MTKKSKIELVRFETRTDIKRPENVVDFLRFYADLVEDGKIEANVGLIVLGVLDLDLFRYSVYMTGFTSLEGIGVLTFAKETLLKESHDG